jgi:recombination protein RecR
MLPAAIENLTEKFRNFPGIGYRSGQKLSLDVLQMTQEDYLEFINSLAETRSKVKFCTNCGFFAEGEFCNICINKTRNKNQICLVEKQTDVITLERSESYRGTYHVLNNLISPLDNIFPEDTTIGDLINQRIKKIILKNVEVQIELILFFRAGFSSEATTAYLRESLLSRGYDKNVQVTRLAQGLPLYYNPDTLDQATMAKALEDRRGI